MQHLHLGLLELHGLERARLDVVEIGEVAGLGRHLDRAGGLELRGHAEGDEHRGEEADEQAGDHRPLAPQEHVEQVAQVDFVLVVGHQFAHLGAGEVLLGGVAQHDLPVRVGVLI